MHIDTPVQCVATQVGSAILLVTLVGHGVIESRHLAADMMSLSLHSSRVASRNASRGPSRNPSVHGGSVVFGALAGSGLSPPLACSPVLSLRASELSLRDMRASRTELERMPSATGLGPEGVRLAREDSGSALNLTLTASATVGLGAVRRIFSASDLTRRPRSRPMSPEAMSPAEARAGHSAHGGSAWRPAP